MTALETPPDVPLPPPRPPVPVVRLGSCTKHPQADTLWSTTVAGNVALFREGQFREGDLAVAVPVDAVVDTTVPVFSFLEPKATREHKLRIRAVRLRGIFSSLLLVEAPEGAQEGDDVAERYGIEKHQGAFDYHALFGHMAAPPKGFALPKYDVSGLREWGHRLVAGEPVQITEKLHGATGIIVMTDDGVVHVGTARAWKKENVGDGCGGDPYWWPAMRAAGMIEKIQAIGPRVAIYGEMFGQVQDLRYGHPDKNAPPFFRAFDVFDVASGRWAEADEMRAIFAQHAIPAVPVLYDGPWDLKLVALAEQDSKLGLHLAEGIVVRTKALRPERDMKLGRSVWKYAGERFLTRKEK
jgi:RNA ligase (TIGR02306 family)